MHLLLGAQRQRSSLLTRRGNSPRHVMHRGTAPHKGDRRDRIRFRDSLITLRDWYICFFFRCPHRRILFLACDCGADEERGNGRKAANSQLSPSSRDSRCPFWFTRQSSLSLSLSCPPRMARTWEHKREPHAERSRRKVHSDADPVRSRSDNQTRAPDNTVR